MKLTLIIIFNLCIAIMLQAQVHKTINVTPGNLSTLLTFEERTTITKLTLIGTIDARDFKSMRDEMLSLAEIDLSGVTINAYTGSEGTAGTNSVIYTANSIPEQAFFNSTTFTGKTILSTIILPPSITSIDRYAFLNCNGLNCINIPSSVTSIGGGAFQGCSGLTSITLPSSITSLSEYVFQGCSKLTSVTIPASVMFIQDWAFRYCSGLTSITIPSTVISIRSNAFQDCVGLKSVTVGWNIPLDLNTVGSSEIFKNVDKTTCKLFVPFGTKPLYASADQWKDFSNIIETSGLVISNAPLTIGSRGGSKIINIESNTIWTASSDQTWLTLNPTTGTIGYSTLTVTATRNNTTETRSANVKVSMPGLEDQIITIHQPGEYVVSAGNLHELLSDKLGTITHLTLIGIIDARDFKTMRDKMPLLKEIDLRDATIAAYTGIEGTAGTNNITYSENAIPDKAFVDNMWVGKSSLESVILPTTLTAIGKYAFRNCSELISVNIPSSVTTIGVDAFRRCVKLASISIPASVTTIEPWAFTECFGLLSVEDLNPTYSSKEGVLFNKAQTVLLQCPISKTGEYIIPSSVKSIENTAFEGCSWLTSVIIPTSVTSIGEAAFLNCNRLMSIIANSSHPIPISKNSINVFNGVNKATCALKIPYGSKEIYLAADHWKEFTNIIEEPQGFFLNSLNLKLDDAEGSTANTSIKSNVAWNVNSDQIWLTTNPNSGTGNHTLTFTAEANPTHTYRKAIITVSAIGVESQFIEIIQDGSNIIVDVTAGNLLNTLTVDELNTITDLTLTGTIDARDFKIMRDKMPLLSKLDLSNVTIVAYDGLEGTNFCDRDNPYNDFNDYNTTYPANTIPSSAFATLFFDPGMREVSKTSLIFFVCPSSITSIGYGAFNGCSGLTSFSLPPTVTSIGSGAFVNCSGLTSINIPYTVTSIEKGAFQGCISLTSINIPPLVTAIKAIVFSDCNSLTSINIPSTVTSIGPSAFRGCSGLKTISIPESVTFIGLSAFESSSGYITVDANNPNYSSSEGVLYDKTYTALIHCPVSKTGHFSIPTTVKTIEYAAFQNCSNLQSMFIPSSVTSIGPSAFANCRNLTSINIPSSITIIEHHTFSSCNSLTSIYIPSSITFIGSNAFEFNLSLKSMYVNSIVPIDLSSIYSQYMFFRTDQTICTLYVPKGSVNLYKSAVQWKDFTNIVEIPEILVSTSNVNIGAARGSTATLSVTSNTTWMISTNQTWLAASPNSANGNQTITFTAATNPTVKSRTATMTISASGILTQDVFVTQQANTINIIPTANAGFDQTINEGTTVFLDGTMSSDPDGNNLTYKWTAPNGIILSSLTDAKPSFIAPEVTQDNHYTFSLVVNNGTFDSPAVEVTVLVKNLNYLQEIILNAGWNIISSNVSPTVTELKTIFQPLIDSDKLRKVMDESGKSLENFGAFGGWKNNIGNWQISEGYKVNVTQSCSLLMEGSPVPLPMDINLNAGWNIISYPSASMQDPMTMLQPLITAGKLKKVMDESGRSLENFGAFGGWKNNIGNFLPGKGYKVNMTTSSLLTIPSYGIKSVSVIPQLLASLHFIPVYLGNGTDHMNIHLVDLTKSGIKEGDEIGVFDGKLCVGSLTVGMDQMISDQVSIVASANDELQQKMNGFTKGHRVGIKLYRDLKIYDLLVDLLNNSSGIFESGESMFARARVEQSIIGEDSQLKVKCYPNPFSKEVSIEIQPDKEQKMEVSVYDVNGKLIKKLYKGEVKEKKVLVWDGKNERGVRMVAGMYFIHVNNIVEKVSLR